MAAHDIGGGRRLRGFRQGLMLTQQDVAERLQQLAWVRHRQRVGVSADMVSKWERGEKRPSGFYLQLLCALFDVSVAQLGFGGAAEPIPPRPRSEDSAMGATLELLDGLGGPVELLRAQVYWIWREDMLGRRDLLKALGLVPAALGLDALSATEALISAPSEPLFRGRESVRDLELLAARFEAAYHEVPPQQMLLPVQALSRTAERWLAGVGKGVLRCGLLRIVGRSQLLLGRLAFFDRHHPMEARAHLDRAREAGIEAADALLATAALGHMAFLPAELHQFSAASSYLDGARCMLERKPVAEVGAWLSAVEAELETNAGQLARALTSLDDARAQLESPGGSARPAWFDFFDEQRLGGFEGFTLRKAGDATGARVRLERALGPGSNQGSKQRAVSMIDLGVVCLVEGDIDGGCRWATDAVLALREAGYAKAVNRLEEFQTLLPDRRHPAARLLSEVLADLS